MKPILRQSGFSLLETLVVMAISSIITLSTANLLSSMLTGQKKATSARDLSNALEIFRASVQSTKGWGLTVSWANHASNTLRQNAKLRCLTSDPGTSNCRTDLPAGNPANYAKIDRLYLPGASNHLANADVLFDRNAKNGINWAGTPCTDAPREGCQLEIDVTAYQLSCDGSGVCLNPSIMVTVAVVNAHVSTAGASTAPLMNLDNYKVLITRGSLNDIISLCTSIGGTWDVTLNKCQFSDRVCGDLDGDGQPDGNRGTYFAGFTSDWQPRCANDECSPGTYIRRFDGLTPICEPMDPDAIRCPAGQRMATILANGRPECLAYERASCLGSQFLGVDENLRAICGSTAPSCPPGEYLREIRFGGVWNCEPLSQGCTGPNEVLRVIDSTGTPGCVNALIGDKQCGAGRIVAGVFSSGNLNCVDVVPRSCPTGNLVLTGYNADGSPICIPRDQPLDLAPGSLTDHSSLGDAFTIDSCRADEEVVNCSCRCGSSRMKMCGAFDGIGAPSTRSCRVSCAYNLNPNDDVYVFATCRKKDT